MAKEIVLLYDKQCPVCRGFCDALQIEGSMGKLRKVDAREPGEIMNEITRLGLDMDQGFVVKIDGEVYAGADAMHQLALLSNRTGFFNRFNYWLFSSGSRSTLIYPALRAGRNLLLKMLGRTKINNLRI